MKFFTYSNCCGVSFFGTEQEARDSCEELLAEYREDANRDGEYHDDVNSIVWGRVLGYVDEVQAGQFVDYRIADAPLAPSADVR